MRRFLPIPIVERSEREISQIVQKRVEAIRDVKSLRQVIVRIAGKKIDVNMNIQLDSKLRFEDIHKVISEIEKEVKNIVANARVSVQTEPIGFDQGEIWKLVKDVAEKIPGSRDVHNIHVQNIEGKLCIDLHLEVSANMTVKQAHNVANQVEKELKVKDPRISDITVHLETASDIVSRELAKSENEVKLYY